jgi:hypothetical protein
LINDELVDDELVHDDRYYIYGDDENINPVPMTNAVLNFESHDIYKHGSYKSYCLEQDIIYFLYDVIQIIH